MLQCGFPGKQTLSERVECSMFVMMCSWDQHPKEGDSKMEEQREKLSSRAVPAKALATLPREPLESRLRMRRSGLWTFVSDLQSLDVGCFWNGSFNLAKLTLVT